MSARRNHRSVRDDATGRLGPRRCFAHFATLSVVQGRAARHAAPGSVYQLWFFAYRRPAAASAIAPRVSTADAGSLEHHGRTDYGDLRRPE
jgi:hypothetical protein